MTVDTPPRIMKPRKFFYEMLDDEVAPAMERRSPRFRGPERRSVKWMSPASNWRRASS